MVIQKVNGWRYRIRGRRRWWAHESGSDRFWSLGTGSFHAVHLLIKQTEQPMIRQNRICFFFVVVGGGVSYVLWKKKTKTGTAKLAYHRTVALHPQMSRYTFSPSKTHTLIPANAIPSVSTKNMVPNVRRLERKGLRRSTMTLLRYIFQFRLRIRPGRKIGKDNADAAAAIPEDFTHNVTLLLLLLFFDK